MCWIYCSCRFGWRRTFTLFETGRAAGYYTHSGDGSRSAKARFERFKERHSLRKHGFRFVTGEDGKKYEVDIEDPEAKARAARKAWEKRQGPRPEPLSTRRSRMRAPRFLHGKWSKRLCWEPCRN